MKTITKPQVNRIKQLVHNSDIYREHGGFVLKSGEVVQVDHRGICKSQIILDENDFNFDEIEALWISHELPAPATYHDDCCDWCENEDVEQRELPNDFLTPGEIDWSDKMGVPVIMYQPPKPIIEIVPEAKSLNRQAVSHRIFKTPAKNLSQQYNPKTDRGVWDYHDPSMKKTVQPHLSPLSERAGISLTDPEHLDAMARSALEYIIAREKVIGEAWVRAVKTYNENRAMCLEAHNKLTVALTELSATERQVQQRLDRLSMLKTPQQVQKALGFQLHILGESKSMEIPPELGVPMQAFRYVKVSR